MEAIDAAQSASLLAKMASLRSTGEAAADYKETLLGGNAETGRQYPMNSSAEECVRCHKIVREGGGVGSDLSNIGKVLRSRTS